MLKNIHDRIHSTFDYKWIVLTVTTIGTLMAAIDSTIVILGLPDMMASLHADLIQMVWVIMGYFLVSTVFLLILGRVADLFGRVRLYNLGFVVFTFGSALCGFAGNAPLLIAFRLLQGVGAAMMVVNSVAIITEAFPPNERGTALGINAITFAAGGVLGPVLGGFILTVSDWHWLFFINIPIGLVGTVWGYIILKELAIKKRETMDFAGALFFSIGLVSLLLALTLGIDLTFTSPPIIALFALFFIFLAIFIWWERHHAYPLLDFSLFRHRVYTFSVLSAMAQSLALYAVNFLIVFYLMGVRGYDALTAAFLLIPLPLMISVMAPIAGRISDRIGARIPATVGLVIQAVALALLAFLTTATPYWQIAVALGLLGLGGGLFFPPNTSAAMNSSPKERLGVASGTLATLRQVGIVTSFALSLAVAAESLPHDVMMRLFVGTNVQLGSAIASEFVIGMRSAFYVSVVLCLVAAVLSMMRGEEDRGRHAVPVQDRQQ